MEKRCNECGWEFYEPKEVIDFEDGREITMKVCPECESEDWEHKLMGRDRRKNE